MDSNLRPIPCGCGTPYLPLAGKRLCDNCAAQLAAAGHGSRWMVCVQCGQRYIGDRFDLSVCASCRPAYDKARLLREIAERTEQWAEVCPPLYLNSDPARLPKLPEVMAWKYGPTGLVMHGETGKGKTRCAWQLLRHLYIHEYKAPVWFDSVSFSHAITKHFGPDSDGERWAEKISTAPLVFFDDLGKARLTERGQAELFGIIENRMANCLPCIITTNFVGDTLAACFRDDVGRALVRRLRECCGCVAF